MDNSTADFPYPHDDSDCVDFWDHNLGTRPNCCTVARCGYVRPYRWISAINADPEEIRALDAQDLDVHCPLDNGRIDTTEAFKNEDLNAISLPPELVYWIIKHLDIRSLTTFRRVSKQAMLMVDGTFEYQQIIKRAPQIIRGALTLEANSFTLNDAYITLSDEACATCRQRGGFIYLITCERVCSKCLIEVPRWKPRVSVEKEWNLLGDPYPNPELTPSAIGRPGIYGTLRGYQRPFVPVRAHRNLWILKNLTSRFWDAEHCGRAHIGCGVQDFNGTAWFASALFVSVSVPLVDHERREMDEEDCSK